MDNLKEKIACVYDHGTFVPVAVRLARDFKKVYYHYPEWKTGFPQLKGVYFGEGYDNVEFIEDFWDHVNEIDVFIFPDVLDADKQQYLRSIGKAVWGAGNGELMELDRIGMRKLMKEVGLPVTDYKTVKGVKALREYIKKNPGTWVKINIFRGNFETFRAENYKLIEKVIDKLETDFGGASEEVEFILEDNLPSEDFVEMGYDGYVVDGKVPDITLAGIEIKDVGYLGKITKNASLPEPIRHFNDVMLPYMKEMGYNGFFSDEIRINKKKIGFMTDATCRTPSPPGELEMEIFTNYSQIIWEGAHGRLIDPAFKDIYGVEIIISSYWAEKNWLAVQIDKGFENSVKLRNSMKKGDTYYIIPTEVGSQEIGAIVATGMTIEQAYERVRKVKDAVHAYALEASVGSIDDAKAEFDRLKKFGYKVL